MATEMPAWMHTAIERAGEHRGVKRMPKPRLHQTPLPASGPVASRIREGAATTSHNTFRPDIFRVSEGYLN